MKAASHYKPLSSSKIKITSSLLWPYLSTCILFNSCRSNNHIKKTLSIGQDSTPAAATYCVKTVRALITNLHFSKACILFFPHLLPPVQAKCKQRYMHGYFILFKRWGEIRAKLWIHHITLINSSSIMNLQTDTCDESFKRKKKKRNLERQTTSIAKLQIKIKLFSSVQSSDHLCSRCRNSSGLAGLKAEIYHYKSATYLNSHWRQTLQLCFCSL